MFFLAEITDNWRSKTLAVFQKICPGIKSLTTIETYFSWVSARPKIAGRLIEMKRYEVERVDGIVGKLDAHNGSFMLKNCFSLPKLLHFLRTVQILIIQLSWKGMTKLYAMGSPKWVTWPSTCFWVLRGLCPLKWVVLGFHLHH